MYLYQDLLKLLDEKNDSGIVSALSQKHNHINKDIMDKITIDSDNNLIYDGKTIPTGISSLSEEEFNTIMSDIMAVID